MEIPNKFGIHNINQINYKMKKNSENSQNPVDVSNDFEMVSLGIRVPVAVPRDESVWTKTDKEKKLLRRLRNRNYNLANGIKKPSYSIPVRDKLIITIAPHPKFGKNKRNKKGEIVHNTITTFSHVCGQSDIPQILSLFNVYDKSTKKMKNLVIKYHWNGKEYAPNMLPKW